MKDKIFLFSYYFTLGIFHKWLRDTEYSQRSGSSIRFGQKKKEHSLWVHLLMLLRHLLYMQQKQPKSRKILTIVLLNRVYSPIRSLISKCPNQYRLFSGLPELPCKGLLQNTNFCLSRHTCFSHNFALTSCIHSE